MSDHTRPERAAEFHVSRPIRCRMLRIGMCTFCKNRDTEAPFGQAMCQLQGRRFPLCNTDGRRLQFEPDYEVINAFAEKAA